MKVYIVIRGSVYRHEICAVMESLSDAEAAATTLAMSECDNRHDFEIMEVELGAISTERTSKGYMPRPLDCGKVVKEIITRDVREPR
jgi:hypothetical protein